MDMQFNHLAAEQVLSEKALRLIKAHDDEVFKSSVLQDQEGEQMIDLAIVDK